MTTKLVLADNFVAGSRVLHIFDVASETVSVEAWPAGATCVWRMLMRVS